MPAPVGNQYAAKAKEWQQSLRRAMARKADGDFRGTLDKIAETVVDLALAGNKDAWQEIANREDGKPTQVIGGDAESAPVGVQVFGWMQSK